MLSATERCWSRSSSAVATAVSPRVAELGLELAGEAPALAQCWRG